MVVVVVVEEAAAAAVAIVVNAKGWGALRIQWVSGRGGGGVACRSWAACPGRSASRKEAAAEEEEVAGRRQWERRKGDPGISSTLSSSSRISHPPLPPSPPHCLLHPL